MCLARCRVQNGGKGRALCRKRCYAHGEEIFNQPVRYFLSYGRDSSSSY